MRGHIRQRGDSFELKLDIGKDPDGKRITEYRTVRGGRRQAETALAKMVAAVDRGEHVTPSKLAVGAHVMERIEQWAALGKITPKTAERYNELCLNQIAPHIGQIALHALKASDVERWHATLLTEGRKDGKGGLSAQTVKHCHKLLGKSLREAQRHDLVIRNAASMQPPPRVPRTEVAILTAEQTRGLVRDLKDRPVYPKAVLALFAGMRLGEVLALRWQSLNLDRKTATVRAALEETKAGGLRFKTPKSEAGVREITLPDIVVETLRAYRRQQQELRLALGLGKLTGDGLVFGRLDGVSADAERPLEGMGRGGGEHRARRNDVPQLEACARESADRRWRRCG